MKRELQKKDEELQKMRVEYDREKLKNDIIIAEKKVVESRFNEIELKLKLKTQEYDELLVSKKFNDKITEQNSIGIQTIEKESSTANVVAVEATAAATTTAATTSRATISSAATVSEETSTAKTGTKRKQEDLVEPRRSKRKANSKTSDTTLASKAGTSESAAPTSMATTSATAVETPMDLSKTIYKCYECIHKWAKKVQRKFPRYWDASEKLKLKSYLADKAQDPDVKTFTNIDDYDKHLDTFHSPPFHDWKDRVIKGKCGIAFLVPWDEPMREYNYTPDGVNICKICDARFDVKARYNQHFELEHADLDKLTRTELYDLWHKYDDNPYAKFEPEHAHLHEEYDRYLQEKYKNDW